MQMTDYRSFGQSGLIVSPLMLGTTTFGAGRWGSDLAEAWGIFDVYVAAGGNVIDTADVYSGGESERMLGQFVMDSGLRNRLVLSTEFGFARSQGHPLHGGSGAINIRLGIEGSLRRLGTDRIDLYWMHVWDRTTPPEEVLRTLAAAVARGEILYYGFSNTPAWYVAKVATLAAAHGLPGPIGLQNAWSLIELGIDLDLAPMPEHAPSWSTVKGYAAENHEGSVADWRAAEDRMDALYKAVAGISHEPPSNGREALRMMRDYNFSRVGGQLGVAQLAEIGNLLGNGGLRVLTQNIPSLRHIFQSARSGGFSDDLFNEIEAIWGFGTDMVRVSPHVKMDDVYGGTFEGRAGASTKMQMADHSLQRAKMVTSVASGMSHVNMALQRFTGRVLVQRFMDDAMGRRAINTTRLRALGVSDDMHPRIQAQMQKHVDQTEGLLGRKVARINIDSWDDIDAKNAFINGVDRWSKKVIQENDPGNMPAIMTKELWKSVFQFRSFMLAAYSKQLLSGIHHRDWETLSSFSTSMFFGALFYAGQTVVNAQGRADKEQFLEKRLSPESLAKASFQRAGFSSLIPLGVDTIAGVTGFGPVFDFRSTDLASGAWGNPTWDLIKGVQGAARGIVAPIAGDDYEFSQQDYRAITSTLLFQNAFVIRNALGALGSELPRYPN